MSNCFTRLLCCWKSSSTLQQQYSTIKQTDEPNVSVDWTTALARGLGEPCVICGENVATHVARIDCSSQCHHSACASCWEAWAEDRCVVCGSSTHGGPIRAPLNVVKQTSKELDSADKSVEVLEHLLDDALAALVHVKQDLLKIKTGLKVTLEHTSPQSDSTGDADGHAAALSVEAVNVATQLSKLAQLVDPNATASTVSWSSSCKCLEDVCAELLRLRRTPLVRAAREKCRNLLQHRGQSDQLQVGLSWRGQVAAIEEARVEVDLLMPQALEAVVSVLAERETLESVTVLSNVEVQSVVQASALEDVMTRVDSAAHQLLSMPSPRSASFKQVSALTPKSRITFDNMLMDERERIYDIEMRIHDSDVTTDDMNIPAQKVEAVTR